MRVKTSFYEYFEDINLNEWYSKGKILDVYPSKIYPIDKDGPFPDFIEKGISDSTVSLYLGK